MRTVGSDSLNCSTQRIKPPYDCRGNLSLIGENEQIALIERLIMVVRLVWFKIKNVCFLFMMTLSAILFFFFYIRFVHLYVYWCVDAAVISGIICTTLTRISIFGVKKIKTCLFLMQIIFVSHLELHILLIVWWCCWLVCDPTLVCVSLFAWN